MVVLIDVMGRKAWASKAPVQITQALSRYVEDFVVAHPPRWYWVHRRWA